MTRSLVVKLTAGADALEKVSQAFTVAATAVASGIPVSLWLTGEATWFATDRPVPALPHSAELDELRTAILAGGTLTLCTQCAARRSLGEDDVLSGVRIAGSATFVEEALAEGAQALVY